VFAEQTAEIQRIIVSHGVCDLFDRILRFLKKVHCIVDPQRNDILHWGCSRDLFEVLYKPTGGHVMRPCIIFNENLSVKTIVEIISAVKSAEKKEVKDE